MPKPKKTSKKSTPPKAARGAKAGPDVGGLTAQLAAASTSRERLEVIEQLAALGPAALPAVPHVLALLGAVQDGSDRIDADVRVANAGMRLLAAIGRPALPELRPLLRGEDEVTAERIAGAIAGMGPDVVREELEALLELAARTGSGGDLGKDLAAGGREVISPLLAVLRQQGAEAPRAVLDALALLAPHDPAVMAEFARAFEAALQTRRSPRELLLVVIAAKRVAAALAPQLLATAKSHATVENLVIRALDSIETASPDVTRYALEAMKREWDESARAELIRILGRATVQLDEVRDALRGFIKAGGGRLSQLASAALAATGDGALDDFLPRLLEPDTDPASKARKREACDALEKMGPAAAPAAEALARLAASGDDSYSHAACRALGAIGPAALPHVGAMLSLLKMKDQPGASHWLPSVTGAILAVSRPAPPPEVVEALAELTPKHLRFLAKWLADEVKALRPKPGKKAPNARAHRQASS